MSGTTIIARRRKSDGKLVRVLPDGREEPFPDPGPLPHLTEEEINAAASTDPDNPPLTPERQARMKPVPQVKVMRGVFRLTQEEFSEQFRIPLETLKAWEEGKTQPDLVARAYLTAIAADPEAIRKALASAPRLVL